MSIQKAGSGKKIMSASIPVELYDEVNERADKRKISRSSIVQDALEQWLQRQHEEDALEKKYHLMTLEGLEDVRVGRVKSSDEIRKSLAARKAGRAV